MSNFIVAKGLGGPLLVTEGWGGFVTSPTEPSDKITDHLTRALSLFIEQFQYTRIVEKTSRFEPYVFNSDPSEGGVDIDTENPITNHLDRALSLFITQFRERRTL